MDIKVSESTNNYGRLFYKCRGCGAFKWVGNDDIVSLPENAINSSGYLKDDIQAIKHQVQANGEFFNMVVKIAVCMYLVLLYIVLK